MYLSNYLENALINATLRNVPFTSPSIVYIALFTSNPTDTGSAGVEVSTTGTAYSRKQVDFISPTDGATMNNIDIIFSVATANWGVITHMGIFDAVSAGNMLYYAPFSVAKTVNKDDQFKILAGNLQISLS